MPCWRAYGLLCLKIRFSCCLIVRLLCCFIIRFSCRSRIRLLCTFDARRFSFFRFQAWRGSVGGEEVAGSKNWLDHELPPECLRKEILEFPSAPHLNQPVAWCSNAHPVKLLSEPSLEINPVQRQQEVTLGSESAEEHRFIFGFRVEQDQASLTHCIRLLSVSAKKATASSPIFGRLRSVSSRQYFELANCQLC